MKEFDYYIYIDYSENLIGYTIIERGKIAELLPKISRFRHYRDAKNRKLYLKNINKTIKKKDIRSYFCKIKIGKISDNVKIYLDVLEFLKEHSNCIIFISVDNNEYNTFERFIKIVDGWKIKVVKESELKKGTLEYQLGMVIDNLLNVERRKRLGQ